MPVQETEMVPSLTIGEPVVPSPYPEKSRALTRSPSPQRELTRSETVIDVTMPLSSFHYQVNSVRIYLIPRKLSPLNHRSNSHGACLTTSTRSTKNLGPSFTRSLGRVGSFPIPFFFSYLRLVFQEDPFEDMKHLDLTEHDSVFVITSAGDNALHYAIGARPKRVCPVYCVFCNQLC